MKEAEKRERLRIYIPLRKAQDERDRDASRVVFAGFRGFE